MDWFQQQASQFFAFSLFIMVGCLPSIIGVLWIISKADIQPPIVDHRESDPGSVKIVLWILGAYMVFITLKGAL